MGRLVAAIAMTHNPRIFWNWDRANVESRTAIEGIFRMLRQRLADAEPQRLIVIGDDHLDNFFLDVLPSFCVGVADAVEGPFWYEEEIMHIPRYRAPGDTELAHQFLDVGMRAGMDLARAYEFRLDHAFCVPLAILRPDGDLPVLPIFTNVLVYPPPSTRRFAALGRAIGMLIRERPAHERIAVITSFNLSLDVGGPKMGKRDEDFDRNVLALMRDGRTEDLLSALPVERMAAAGNSTVEFLNYCVMLGLVADRPPAFLEYRLDPAWGACPFAAWDLN